LKRARDQRGFFRRNRKRRRKKDVIAAQPVHTALRRIREHIFLEAGLANLLRDIVGFWKGLARGFVFHKFDAEEQAKASRWEILYPWVLTAKVRNFFGPWHGKFAFSDELYSDTSDRNTVSLEGHLQRRWSTDEVQLNGHYDYSRTNNLTTTDLIKADGSWRHDFPDRVFAAYRPTLEWNRDYFVGNLPADYVLLQQEVGVGYNLIATLTNQLRAGVSENIFSNWVLPNHEYVSHYVESVFIEAQWKLPWRMTLSDRNVYYYSLVTGHDGWENKIELDKKLTETLSVGVRNENRHNNPDLRQANYRLLRFYLGFDF